MSIIDNEKKWEAYYNCLELAEDGYSINDLRLLLKDYEKREDYIYCCGIKKAIENISFNILLELTKESKNNIEL